uniref:Cytochrome c biogenesis protein CcsA n=1 Tax=Spirogyra maxima TaxID=3180 RepID=A0A191T4D5_SPIMX|nr:heme attachment to plastid cytochrome c [Spirogyra maxima]ANI25256.1 heme attachment to plastid cytochrome c [Spirogyra maxima]
MILVNLEQVIIVSCFYSLLFATVFFWLKNSILNVSIIHTMGNMLMLASNIGITLVLINRWIISKHVPLSNLYESTMFLTWSLTIVYFLLYKKKNDWLAIIIAPSAMLTYGFAILGLPEEMQQVTLLIPALQSYWLMMHVSMMILSYAALICGSLLSMTLLVIDKIFNFQSIKMTLQEYYPILSFSRDEGLIDQKYDVNYMNLEFLCFDKNQFNLTNQLDYWSFRIIGIGFPFLTIGIMSGAVWANEAWGSYWSWDPKETWAFITWLVFAIYLHIRISKNWNNQISSMVASLGFLVVWICYLGVNLLGKGLHSYGWFN